MGRLERQIRALLRRRFSRLLSPRPMRAPVLGGRNTVRPDGGRKLPNGGRPGWWVTIISRLEHGLLTVSLSDLLANPATTTPKIAVTTNVGGYYGGAGTPIPGAEPPRSRHVVGRLGDVAGLSPPTDWPDTAPLVSAGVHPSVHGAGSWTRVVGAITGGEFQQWVRIGWKPEQYSGLAVAWVQSWVGAGLSQADIAGRLPEGWSTAPGKLGLVRDPAPNGDYWAMQASIDGMLAVRMRPDTISTQVVAGWIADNALGTTGGALAPAYPLAALRQAGFPVTLIPADVMEDAYAGHGETSEGSSIVLIADDLPSDATATNWTWATDYAYDGVKSLKQQPNTNTTLSSYISTSPLVLVPEYGSTAMGSDAGLSIWVRIESTGSPYELLFGIWDGSAWYSVFWGSDHPSFQTGRYANRVRLGAVPSARGEWVELVIPTYMSPGPWNFGGRQILGVQILSVGGPSSCKVWWDSLSWVQWGNGWGAGPAVPMQAGWVWDAAAARCDIVTIRQFNPTMPNAAFESMWSSAILAWEDGIPTATLETRDAARWRPYWQRPRKLWVIPSDGGEPSLVKNRDVWAGADGCADSAPVAVFFTDGQKRLLWYDKDVATWQETGTFYDWGDSLNSCGLESPTRSVYTGALLRVRGGYRLDGVMDQENALDGTGTIVTSRWTASPKGYPSGPYYTQSSYQYTTVRNAGAEACGPLLPTWTEMSEAAAAAAPEGGSAGVSSDQNLCVQDVFIQSRTLNKRTSGEILILDLRCHGALWAYRGGVGGTETWSSEHLRIKEDGSVHLPAHTSRAYVLVRYAGETAWQMAGTMGEATSMKGMLARSSCDVIDYSSGTEADYKADDWWIHNAAVISHRQGAADIIAESWGNWNPGLTDPAPDITVWACASASSAMVGQAYPEGPLARHGWDGEITSLADAVCAVWVGRA